MSTPTLIGNATLFLGDCLSLLPEIQNIHALVADPPYGIGYCHSGHAGKGLTKARTRFNKLNNGYVIGDDQPFDPAHLLDVAPKIILWGANHYADKLPPSARWLIWDKVCSATSYGKWTFADVEMAWSNLKGTARLYPHLWNGCRRAGEENSFLVKRCHPTQKPVAVMSWCIQLCDLPPNSLVVDPYMGSGTTGIAAVSAGHRFIGMELDPQHFAPAVTRIQAEHDRLNGAGSQLLLMA